MNAVMPARDTYDWVVLNQSQSPDFQQMIGRLADALGPCLVYTGMPHEPSSPALTVEAAPPYDRRNLIARARSWLHYGAAAACRLVRLGGQPLLLVTTNPPFLPQLAWIAHRLWGVPYAVIVWDVYPDHLVGLGWFDQDSPLVRAWQQANRLALQQAELLITLSDGMAARLRRQLGPRGDGHPIEVVPIWVDTNVLRPLAKRENAFAEAHGQVDKTTVLYSGNIGATHGLSSLIDAAAALADDSRISFVLIGDGLGRPALEQAIVRQRLANVLLLESQPWQVLPLSLATAEIAVVGQAPGSETLSLPSKTYSAMAVGSAILALTDHDSDLARLVHAHDMGTVCAPDDPAAIVAAIRSLSADPGRLQRQRKNARRAAEQHFSAEVIEKRLHALLDRTLNPPTRPS